MSLADLLKSHSKLGPIDPDCFVGDPKPNPDVWKSDPAGFRALCERIKARIAEAQAKMTKGAR